jgi:putative two-component system response regulator
MKKHSAEGAKVIHEILLNTDNDLFKLIAENVAHYHHERWDGSGYPEGKKGEEIPLEARIMAIADVYDALVSKRVYKEAFDFDKADRIIIEGMGTQFDPGLKSAYEKAREKLEDYYGRNRD